MGIEYDPHPLFQEFAHPEKFVSAAWLSARLGTDGLRVVESDEDAFLYDIGHIPGAMRIDWQRDLNSPVTRDFIDGGEFARLMASRGISRDDTIVVYGDSSNWWATYTAWVLELFGHPDVRLLDGGRDAWMGEERDTSYVVPDYPETSYPVVERVDTPIRTFVSDLLAELPPQLIDSRSPELFAGTPPAPSAVTGIGTASGSGAGTATGAKTMECLRYGHIPGAINVPWNETVYPNARFRARAEIEAVFEQFDRSARTVTYSQLGAASSHSWYVLRHILGFDNVGLYDGSWAEWGNMVKVPIRNMNL